jgi:hypothetical protein
MATLFRRSSAYDWDCVWLLEFEIFYYHESAESQAKYINGTANNI